MGPLRRVSLVGSLIIILAIILMARPATVRGEPPDPRFSGRAEIVGPLGLVLTVDPPVLEPGGTVTIALLITNSSPDVATPEVQLVLPPSLSMPMQQLPAGTLLNLQSNTISWFPVLGPANGPQELRFTLPVGVADMVRPEQAVQASLILAPGSLQTISSAFWVGVLPQAAISLSPQRVSVGQPVQLRAEVAGPGPFVQTWDLGDGRAVAVADPQVVYPTPGLYTVSLRLANPLGVVRVSGQLEVVALPIAAFRVDDATPGVGQEVAFASLSGGAPPLTHTWSFGDGQESQVVNPRHRFEAPGQYEVSLVVQNAFGTARNSWMISVGAPPAADLVIPLTVAAGVEMVGQAFGDASVSRYLWDMGDGAMHEGAEIRHVYRESGEHYVTLIARNDFGDTPVGRWITVDPGIWGAYLPLVVGDVLAAEVGNPGPLTEPEAIPATAPGAPTTDDPVDSTTPAAPPVLVQPAAANPDNAAPSAAPAIPEPAPLAPGATPPEQLLWYINEARRLHNLPPAAYNYELSVAAQSHAEDMSIHDYTGHVGTDGSTPPERLYRFGYRGVYAGEATAWGFDTAIAAVEFWINSPAHRAILLNPAVTEVGVGFTADYNAPNLWYWTAEFAFQLPDA